MLCSGVTMGVLGALGVPVAISCEDRTPTPPFPVGSHSQTRQLAASPWPVNQSGQIQVALKKKHFHFIPDNLPH